MATTAGFTGLEPHYTNDAMDLHSDNGYGMDDGDIDLDVPSAPEVQQAEDDVLSLQDAGADGHQDVHGNLGDQDDFMVDEEDIIDEDDEPVIDYGDLELEEADQPGQTLHVKDPSVEPGAVSHAMTSPQTSVQEVQVVEDIEEDLIDYSDEDVQAEASADAVQQYDEAENDFSRDEKEQEQGLEASETFDFLDETTVQQDEQQSEVANKTEQQPWENDNAAWDQHQHQHHSTVNEDSSYAAEEQDKNADQAAEEFSGVARDVENDREPTETEPEQDHQAEEETQQNGFSEAEQKSALPPITVNYDGSEYWLFKSEHAEDGECLLEDDSIATQPISYVFAACRAQLGDDISGQTEIGFRFDHFYSLELYEDCTACAMINLKDLVDIYQDLHAQDGNNDPESFYITLQFRPRVLTMIGDLRKGANDQIGFSGLGEAIAAGHTNFNSAFMREQNEQYEEHHATEDPAEEDESRSTSYEQNEQYGEHHATEDPAEEDKSRSISYEKNEKGVDAGAQDDRHESGEDEEENAEEDLISYREEDAPANPAMDGDKATNDFSSASSTVQGDDPNLTGLDGEATINNADMRGAETAQYFSAEADADDDEHEAAAVDEESSHEHYPDGGENNAEYQDEAFQHAYDQDYDQDDFVQTYGLDDYQTEDVPPDGSGQCYVEETPAVGDQVQAARESTDVAHPTADDGFTGVDDFLDLTRADEDFSIDDPTMPNDQYDEDTTVEAAVASSSAASLAKTAPTRHEDHGSPQGQKRSIDAVDVEQPNGSDSTDTKRPKL